MVVQQANLDNEVRSVIRAFALLGDVTFENVLSREYPSTFTCEHFERSGSVGTCRWGSFVTCSVSGRGEPFSAHVTLVLLLAFLDMDSGGKKVSDGYKIPVMDAVLT